MTDTKLEVVDDGRVRLNGGLGCMMACKGFQTIAYLDDGGTARECLHCGMKIRHDLVDHPIFGFAAECIHDGKWI